MIRRAEERDIPRLLELLKQVNQVHFELRPDLFKKETKYNANDLERLLKNEDHVIFVYDDEGVQGYLFSEIKDYTKNQLLQPIKTLYIDDLCVDEQSRGNHVGKKLLEHAKEYAKENHFHNITLHVWEGNDSAYEFYKRNGMKEQSRTMEMIL